MIRRAAWAFAIAVAVVAATIAGALALLQSEAGGRAAAHALSALASTPGEREFAIERIEPGLPRRLAASGIEMRDKNGRWLVIDRAEIAWRPLALLRGLLHIERAAARGVRLDRLPESDASADGDTGFALPRLPIAVRLDGFALDDAEIGAAIAGEPVSLNAEGKLAAEAGGEIRTSLSVTRTNGVGGEANIAIVSIPGEATLDVDARVEEPRGGVVGRALGLAGAPPLTAVVAGHGPVDGWNGRVDIALGEAVGVNASIRSERANAEAAVVVRLSGRADIAALLDDPLRPLAADGVDFSAVLGRLPDGGLRVADLALAAAAGRLTGAGTIDLGAGRFADSFHLNFASGDPAALAPLLAPLRLTGFTAGAGLSGALDRPKVDAVGRIDGLAGDGFSVREVRWTAGVVPRNGRLTIDATADVAGIAAGETDVDALIGGPAALSLRGSLDPGSTFDVADLRLVAPAATLSGTGSLDLAGGGFTGAVDATVPDIAALAVLVGPDLAGRVHLRADIGSDDGRPRADVAVDTAHLRTNVPAVDVLLGSAPSARAAFALAADGAIRVEDVAVDGEEMRLDGEATLRNGAIDAVYRAQIPAIARAAEAAGMALRGEVRIDGTASGPIEDPDASASVLIADGGVAAVAVRSARIDLNARQLRSRPRGAIAADARLDAGTIRARLPFAREGEAMRLGPFTAEGLGLSASGDLTLPLDGKPICGLVKARYDGAGRPAAVAGYRLRGNAGAEARFAAAKGGQKIEFAVDGYSLALEDADGAVAAADVLSLHGSLTGSERNVRGDVRLSSERLAYGATTLAALQGRLSGTGESAGFQLSARSPAGLEGEVRTRGRLATRDGGVDAVVQAIDGRLGGQTLSLRRPLNVVIGDGEVAARDLDLAVGGGFVSATLRTGDNGTEGTMQARRLPLSLIAAIRPDLPLSGTADAEGSLRTQGSQLVGRFSLDLNKVRISRLADAKVFDATAAVSLETGAARAEVRIAGLGQPLMANARVPASIDARTFAVQLPPSAPLAGRLTWAGPVARLWELLPLTDQRLRGEADVDLTLGGRVDDPRIEGALKLSDAQYEHYLTGTVIRNLELTALAPGGGAVNVDFAGNDGGEGKIAGRGTATLGAGLRPTAEVAVTLDNATLVRRDDVTAALSGTVIFREGAAGAGLAGRLTTDRMEIRLVDRLPPSVVKLDVTEINLPAGRTPRNEPDSAQAGSWAAALDIQVDMPRRVFVRGRGLESEWQGKLDVTGTTVEPILIGAVRILSGVFDFAGKRFTLEKGDIGFTGGKKIDPTVNLEAVRETEDITAIVAVTGTALDPEIALRSRPDLPESEILSRVLFDKDVAKLGPIEAAQLGLALDTLASGESMSEDALSYVRDLLGLDVLTVDPGSGNGEGPTLGVGRYVGEGLYVGAKQGTEPGQTSGTVELEVLPGLSVESEVGQDEAGATGALGLRWKWDY